MYKYRLKNIEINHIWILHGWIAFWQETLQVDQLCFKRMPNIFTTSIYSKKYGVFPLKINMFKHIMFFSDKFARVARLSLLKVSRLSLLNQHFCCKHFPPPRCTLLTVAPALPSYQLVKAAVQLVNRKQLPIGEQKTLSPINIFMCPESSHTLVHCCTPSLCW